MFSSRTNWHLELNRFSLALGNHRRGGRPLLDLTASNPTTCGFVYPQDEILGALADPRALRYAPESMGLLEARQAIAGYYRGRQTVGAPDAGAANVGSAGGSGSAQSREIDPQRILLTSGTSEAYSHIFRLLCEPGDEVLVPAPSYPLFEFLANLADVQLVPYPLVYGATDAKDNANKKKEGANGGAGEDAQGWQIDLSALRAAITSRSRAVLVVHPNNPTGSFVTDAEAAALAEICARREMAVVADEVFLDFAQGDASPGTFAFQRAALTFTLSGLSKVCALPQMKLAWLVVSGPEPLVRTAVDRLEIIADTYLSPGTPVQLAAAKLLSIRGAMQQQLRRRIAANLAHLDAALAPHAASGSAAPPTVQRLARRGGWYAILRAPSEMSDEEIAVALIERESVLVHPGQFFDFAQDGFLVLSLITPEEEFQEGVCRLLRFFASR